MKLLRGKLKDFYLCRLNLWPLLGLNYYSMAHESDYHVQLLGFGSLVSEWKVAIVVDIEYLQGV